MEVPILFNEIFVLIFPYFSLAAALVTLLVAAVATVRADPLPLVSSSLGSNMVLQSAPSKARIWGWTPQASQQVTVNLNNGAQVKQATSGASAPFFWSVDLDPITASFTTNVIVVNSGSNVVKMTNVLFGEVFICSGQSNMQMGVAAALNATEVRSWLQIISFRLWAFGASDQKPTIFPPSSHVHVIFVLFFRKLLLLLNIPTFVFTLLAKAQSLQHR